MTEFFDKHINLRLREAEYDDLKEIVKKNYEVDTVSQLIRIAVIQYLNRIKKETTKKETTEYQCACGFRTHDKQFFYVQHVPTCEKAQQMKGDENATKERDQDT